MSGIVERELRARIEQALSPLQLEIKNESLGHGLPPSAEKHFRVYLVASRFEGLSRLERHRLVHEACGDLLLGKIHALAVQAVTPVEAGKVEKTRSPECAGRSQRS